MQVHAVSLNYRDLLVLSGRGAAKAPSLIPCSDAAGIVTEIGADVARWRIGNRVCPIFYGAWMDGPFDRSFRGSALGGGVDGVLADSIVVDEHAAVATPSGLSFAEAATLPCAGVTAWRSIVAEGGVKPGDIVVVHGSGGVALFSLQFATTLGARVIAVSGSPQKADRLLDLGASDVLDRASDWHKTVLAATNGRGADIVVDLGGPSTLSRSITASAFGGRIILVGVLGGTDATINLPQVFAKQISLIGVSVGSRAHFEDMNRKIDATKLKPVIDCIFPFEDAPAALEHLSKAHHLGKVVVAMR